MVASPPADPEGSHEAVIAANARFYAAFEAMDLDAMGHVWSERSEVSCIHPGWHLISGRDAVLASWEGIFRGTERIRFVLRDPRVFVTGDAAWLVLVEEIMAEQDNSAVHAYAHTTNFFVREDGTWRLVHHHAAPVPMGDDDEPPPGPSRVLH
jgi:uncharacterized protein (TIGR02246 family)